MSYTEKILKEFDTISFCTEKVVICSVCNMAYLSSEYTISLCCKNENCEGVVEPTWRVYQRRVKAFLAESIQQVELETLKKVTKIIEKEKYTWAKESIGNKALQSMEKALQEYI